MTSESGPSEEFLDAVSGAVVADSARVVRDAQSVALPSLLADATDTRVYLRSLHVNAIDVMFAYAGREEVTSAGLGPAGARKAVKDVPPSVDGVVRVSVCVRPCVCVCVCVFMNVRLCVCVCASLV